MKYKVGDKVRVRDDLVVGKEYGGVLFRSSMQRFKGDTFIIKIQRDESSYTSKETSQKLYELTGWIGDIPITSKSPIDSSSNYTIGHHFENNTVPPEYIDEIYDRLMDSYKGQIKELENDKSKY